MDKIDLSQFDTVRIAQQNTSLIGNATFTSDIILVRGFSKIVGFVFSDVSSATNGFKIQQALGASDFASNLYTEVLMSYTGNDVTTNAFNITVSGDFARIVYINGSMPQTNFRLLAQARIL